MGATQSNPSEPSLDKASVNSPTLIEAIDRNDVELVKLLLKKGANPNRLDSLGYSPLWHAVSNNRKDIAKELIKQGADVNYKFKSGSGEQIPVAKYLFNMNYYDIIPLIIKKGFNVNSVIDPLGNTVLHNLVKKSENIPIIQILVDNGANININDRDGETPLDVAIAINDQPMIKFLKEKGANVGTLKQKTIDKDVLYEYIKEQQAFLETLTPDERNLLKSYTLFGDRVINQVLRGNITNVQEENKVFMTNLKSFIRANPLFQPQGVQTRIQRFGIVPEYVGMFLNVFKKVPVLKKELTVYRGIEREQDILTHGNEFLSTSYSPNVSRLFSGPDCCFLTIRLKPGIRAFLVEEISNYRDEKEILIGPPFEVNVSKVDTKNFNVSISPKIYKKGSGRKTRRRKDKKIRRH
jgi:hypothetical protein